MRFNPWRGLAGLPREIWVLFTATLVNRAGSMALALLILYLTRVLGWTTERAGLFLGLYGIGSIISSPISGRFVDRFGERRVMLFSLLTSGVLMLVFPLLRSPLHLGIATLVWAFAADSFRPASMTAVSQLVPPARRKAAYSSYRLALNLGMSIGPALGGFLATRSFKWVFGVDGVTAILAGIVLWLAPWRAGGAHGASRPTTATSTATPWRDWHYLFFLAATLPVGLVFFQSISTMAVYVTRDLGLSTTVYGLLFTVNTLLIVFLEVSLSTATAHWPHRRTLALGSLLVGLGFGALALARDTFTAMLTVVVWTFGEMVFFPGANAFVADMAPAGRTGTFMGLYTMTFGLSLVLAPWLGTQAMQHFGPRAPWIAALGCGMLSAVLLGRMSPRPANAVVLGQVILSTAEGDA